MKKRTTLAIYVTAFALLLSTVGIGYAWFSGRVETISESSNSVITKAANLGTIIFSNGNVIRIDDVNPGWCETKRVSIETENATLGSIYKINLTVVRNELAQLGEDLG